MGFCFCREETSCKIQFAPFALLIGFLVASYRTEQASDDQGLVVLNGPGGDLKGSLRCLTRGYPSARGPAQIPGTSEWLFRWTTPRSSATFTFSCPGRCRIHGSQGLQCLMGIAECLVMLRDRP